MTTSHRCASANTRGYALQVNYPSTWTADLRGDPDPVYERAVRAVVKAASPAGRGRATAFILPPTSVVEITAPKGAAGRVTIDPSSQAYLAIGVVYGVETLGLTFKALPGMPENASKSVRAIDAMFTSKDCVKSFGDHVHLADPSSANGASIATPKGHRVCSRLLRAVLGGRPWHHGSGGQFFCSRCSLAS